MWYIIMGSILYIKHDVYYRTHNTSSVVIYIVINDCNETLLLKLGQEQGVSQYGS